MAGGKLSLFIPINKIDEEQRLVYGEVASETVDNAGETFDYVGSKPYFQKWSDNAFATSGGKSHGNVRVMHTSKVAGIVNSPLGFDDENKVISACAKVVDDDDWKKVLAGAYTGFSMGGRYVSRVTKGDEKRYVAEPVEISLVDKPCISTATFEVVKADGTTEEHHFASELWITEMEELVEKAEQARHSAGTGSGGKFASGVSDGHGLTLKSRTDPTGHGTNKGGKAIKPVKPAKPKNGDKVMREPTNDEMLPVAQKLAKAAGKTDADWMEFVPLAREQLIAEGDVVEKVDDVSEVVEAAETDEDVAKGDKPAFLKDKESDDEDEKSEDDEDDAKEGEDEDEGDKKAKKADVVEDEYSLGQFWKAKDGTFHARKADAVAANEAIDADALAKADENPLLAQLRDLNKSAEDIVNGEEPKEGEDGSDGDDGAIAPEVEKYAAFFEGVVAKSTDIPEGADGLRKSLYHVERLACVLRSAASLQLAVSAEQKREGDASTLPGEIGIAVGQLGEVLVSMAREEVDELMLSVAAESTKEISSPYYDSYIELSASNLGLEKSAFETDEFAEKLAKRSPGTLEKADPSDELAKYAKITEDAVAKADKLEGEMTEMGELVKGLADQLEAIKKMPMGKAPTTSFAKGDNPEAPGAPAPIDLTKFSGAELADAAIRLSQQHGQVIGIPMAPPVG